MEIFSKKQTEAAARKANMLTDKMEKKKEELEEMANRYHSLKDEIDSLREAIDRLEKAFYLKRRGGEYMTETAAEEYDKKKEAEEDPWF